MKERPCGASCPDEVHAGWFATPSTACGGGPCGPRNRAARVVFIQGRLVVGGDVREIDESERLGPRAQFRVEPGFVAAVIDNAALETAIEAFGARLLFLAPPGPTSNGRALILSRYTQPTRDQ